MSNANTFIPKNEWFEQWEQKTGEKEPDFSSLRSFPDLQPLLEFYNGSTVRTIGEWEKRKVEIRQLLCHYFLGTFPAAVPSLVRADILSEFRELGAVRREIKLTFDTLNQASFTMEVMIPDGDGPFPVFLTQTNHRGWGIAALSRGYIVCIYPGADRYDQSDVFLEAYPECDWSLIPRRAWLGSRALDYVLGLPCAAQGQVGITGHSRNGKQALIAAAFDERITAVISSSSGAAGASPYRFNTDLAFQGSVERTTARNPTWFHPRMRYFTGREHLLPIDIHGVLGLVAPRACLISTAFNDSVESTFAIEKSYTAVKEVYCFLDKPDKIRIRWRPGEHAVVEEDVHSFIDWLDLAFGRAEAEFPEQWLHRFDWSEWMGKTTKEREIIDPITKQANKRARILWGLGEDPPCGVASGSPFTGGKSFGTTYPLYKQLMMGLDNYKPADTTRTTIVFGEGVQGNLYYRGNESEKRPVVIWLPPFSFSSGLSVSGNYSDATMPRIFNVLAEQGYVVMAFDHIGFGSRIEEGRKFYNRYNRWSRLGKMVRDVQGAVNFLSEENMGNGLKLSAPLPLIDDQQIYCLGYSLGGMVALYAAALDERIAGVASFCGFTPMRTDTDKKHTGGIRRLWESYSLQPRLGLYHNRESELPYDFDDVISLIAPRPCLIVSPIHDREADHGDIVACVKRAKESWTRQAAGDRFSHLSPNDYNRFHPKQHNQFLNWLQGVIGVKP